MVSNGLNRGKPDSKIDTSNLKSTENCLLRKNTDLTNLEIEAVPSKEKSALFGWEDEDYEKNNENLAK